MKTTRKVRAPRPESRARIARAYRDAVRDILVADGLFHLGDDRRGDTVWQWDGLRWRRLTLLDSGHGEPRPDADGDVAAVG
jgi:hypothetical protein